MPVRVHVPISLTVDAGALQGDALAQLVERLRPILEQHWLTAQQELHADGVIGTPRVAEVCFDWTGRSRRQLSEPARRAVEQRLATALESATRRVLLPPAPVEDWTYERLELRAPLGPLLALVEALDGRRSAEHRIRFRDQLDDRVFGVAWVVATAPEDELRPNLPV